MDDQIKESLQKILQKNRMVWGAVLSGVVFLMMASLGLYNLELIDPLPIVHPQTVDNSAMFLILIFVISIFYIKQTKLTPAKLLEKSKNPNLNLNSQLLLLAEPGTEKRQSFLKCIHLYNRYILIIWFLADLVVVTAFVSFILAPVVNKMIMYGLVGLFSLLINFPSFNVYQKIHSYIND